MSGLWKDKAAVAAFNIWKYGQQASNTVAAAAVTSKDWVAKNPGHTVGCVAAAPVAIALAPLALGAAGFTASGVAAGKYM